MTCSLCNGQRYKAPDVPCGRCGGKGVVEPLTNEEWFCSLSTEEKAKFFKNFNPCDKCPAQKICDTVRNCENSFLKWLKEKRHD